MVQAMEHAVEAEGQVVLAFHPAHVLRGGEAFFDTLSRHPAGNAEAGVAVDGDIGEALLARIGAAETGDAERRGEVLAEVLALDNLVHALIANDAVDKQAGVQRESMADGHVLHAGIAQAWVSAGSGADAVAEDAAAAGEGVHLAIAAPDDVVLIALVI